MCDQGALWKRLYCAMGQLELAARWMPRETYVTVTLAAQQIQRVEQSYFPAVPVRSSASAVCHGTESAADGGRAYATLSIRRDICRHSLVLDCWLDCDYPEKIPEDILPGVTSKNRRRPPCKHSRIMLAWRVISGGATKEIVLD
jgi:hypothetical protein